MRFLKYYDKPKQIMKNQEYLHKPVFTKFDLVVYLNSKFSKNHCVIISIDIVIFQFFFFF